MASENRTTKLGTFTEEQNGSRVATIRHGDNAVEMKDNRDGTADLTIFWSSQSGADDLTAFRLDRNALMAIRRAIDGMLISIAGSGNAEDV